MLAMDVNDYAGRRNARGVMTFFASMLAPTRQGGVGKHYRRPGDNRLIKT
jgi:hypothetical protein